MTASKQISEFPDAGALSATDYILLQQGATGTALSKTMLGPILDTPHTTMTVSGAGSVSGNLTVGNAKFVVTAASGNTVVAGTLAVTGASTLAALSATTGTFSSTLGVTGAATLSSTLGVTGAVTLASTLGVTGNFAVATNKFTVASASGNTAVAGTLVTTGALTSSTSTTTKILNIAPGAHDLAGQYSPSTAPFSLAMSLPRPSVVPLGKRNIIQWSGTGDVVAPGALANQGGSLNFFDITQRSGHRIPLTTNGVTAAGNATLNFASTTGVTAGMFIDDASGGIPAGSTVVSTTATTVVSSAVAVGSGVTSGASIVFRGLVANSWSGSRTIARFTWSEDNHPVEQSEGPSRDVGKPSVGATWSTIQAAFNRGGNLPTHRHSRGSNVLDYGMVNHLSGSTNLTGSRLYEGSLFFQPNTSVRAALGFTVHTPTTAGTAPTETYIAYTTRRSSRTNLSWRGVFVLGEEGSAGIDALRGTLSGYKASHADPTPQAFVGLDLQDANFSGRAIRWIGGDIAGGAHDDAGAGRLRLGNGFLTPTATGLQIDAVGYRGSPAGTIFSLGGSLVNGAPVVEIRNNSIGDDAYGGTYQFYSPDYVNNRFTRVMVLNPPTTNGAAPSNPIEVKLRHNSSAQMEFPVTDVATTTAHPTELTATSATAYNGRYLVYYTGVCAGEKQLITGFDPATRILTTAAFSQVPTVAINLITNFNFGLALPTSENTVLNAVTNKWQYTLNGNMSLVTNGTTSVGNATLNFASTTGIAVGMVIADASGGIPPGSTVVSMTSTTVVSSAVAVGAGVASGAAIYFQGAGGTGTVVRNLVGFKSAELTGDGTNAASLDHEITWPANSRGVLRISAGGPYRVKLGTTRGVEDIFQAVNIERDVPPEGEDYERITEDFEFSSTGTTVWLRIETEQTIPVRIYNVRCADVEDGSDIVLGLRAGVEAVPLTVSHTWTQRNTLELQPGAGPATFGGTLGVTGNFAVATNKFTVAAATGNAVAAGSVTGTAFIPSSTVIPSNGMYLPAGNTLGFAINLAAEMQLTASALSAAVDGGLTLGNTSLGWGGAHFSTGAALNFVNGDVIITHSSNLLTMAGGGFTFSGTRPQGDFLVETAGTSASAPGVRARGYRSDSNGSIDFGGQFFAEGVRTDALFASGKAFGGLIFGGNTDLTPTMGYTASITGVADAAWVDTSNAATAIVFRTGTAAQARAANIHYGTDRGRITSGGRWLLGSSTDDASTTVQVNGTFKATGASTLAAITATTGAFTGATTVNLSGTSLTSIAGYVFGAAAGDGHATAVVLDAAGIYPRYVLRRTNGTSASRTAIVLNDVLGALEGRGYDGSAFTVSHAGIDFAAAENWSGAARGGKIAFRTTTNGATTGAGVKMTLENSGALLIGGTTDDGTNKLRVSGGVTVDTGNSYKINDVAVVGATKTGWTAATGTATRTTFVTSTVTTEQLAQRVKALLDDLISHGLIGT